MHRRPVIRYVARTVAFATALAAVVAGVSSTHSVEAASGLPEGTLGQFIGFDDGARFNQVESALGRQLDHVVTMADHKSPSAMRSSVWGQFTKPSAYLPDLSDRLDVTVTIPLAFGENARYRKSGAPAVLRGLRQTAAGAYDADYRIVARNLIAAGYSDAVLRLGHEFDGTWYPWSARDNEQGYIEAFRHVHDVFAQESSNFRFEWTGTNAPWRTHAPAAYPGDAYVDIVGLDIYYRSKGAISDRVWDRYEATLSAHRDFASARGKPVSYPEWGRGFDDTDRFITLMHGWFSGLPSAGPGSLEYQSYFNKPGRGGNYDLNEQPTVKRRYVQLFSTTSSGATVRPAAQPPTLSAPAEVPAPPASTSVPSPAVPITEATPTTTAVVSSSRSIALVPQTAALELNWFDAGDERRNVRYRTVGSTSWTWISNGAWSQVISGLDSGTVYEVHARAFANGSWQPWLKATATAN